MRIYIDGELDNQTECFIPTDLFFSTEDNEDPYEVSEKCVCISGDLCESSVEENKFSTRWKGVSLETTNGVSEASKEDVLNLIKDKTLKGVMFYGLDEYEPDECEMHIDKITILDGPWGTETVVPKNLYSQTIRL